MPSLDLQNRKMKLTQTKTLKTTLLATLSSLVLFGCEAKTVNKQPAAQPENAPTKPEVTTTTQTLPVTAPISTSTPTKTTSVTIGDQLLERYVGAYIKMSALQQQVQAKIDAAVEKRDIEAIENLQRESDLMAKAILSEANLTENEFTDIRHQIKLNPKLSERGEAIFNRFMENAGK